MMLKIRPVRESDVSTHDRSAVLAMMIAPATAAAGQLFMEI
ncbi:MAG TPA: hypothetical protein VL551_05490 [Actinospica sp.]|jgi:hypothetical protein|nr:hypothetical protein [Actinospica sp.]